MAGLDPTLVQPKPARVHGKPPHALDPARSGAHLEHDPEKGLFPNHAE
jgi:hypothetical protein